jgi:hypothetical protein
MTNHRTIPAPRTRAASRWSQAILLTDGLFLVSMGVFLSISATQSHADGSGPFGRVLEGQPYVVGFVEAALLIAVIGSGLLAAGVLAPTRIWHGWAVLAHLALAGVDLSYMDTMASMQLPTANVIALVTTHALFITAHGTRLVVMRRTNGLFSIRAE